MAKSLPSNEPDSLERDLDAFNPLQPILPEILGYDLIRLIGQGAFGHVWLARSRCDAHRVLRAIKIVPGVGHESVELIGVHEAVVALTGQPEINLFLLPLDGPHELHNDSGVFSYYVMAIADGVDGAPAAEDPRGYVPRTLAWEIANGTQMSAESVLRLGLRLGQGVAALHRKGRRHFDIKPSNIVLLDGEWKITDTGLVESFWHVGPPRFTPGYHVPDENEPPESLRHDLYAIGKTLFQAHTCRRNVADDQALEWFVRTRGQGRQVKGLRKVVRRACVERSYSSADQLIDDIRSALRRELWWLRVLILVWAFLLTSAVVARFLADPGAAVIRQFYASVERKDFPTAWGWLHSARKKELAEKHFFGPEDLERVYATTIRHRNLNVRLLDKKDDVATYNVSFDAEDEFPRNDLFHYVQQRKVGDMDDRLRREGLQDGVLENVKNYYQVPDDRKVLDFLKDQPLGFLFHAECISEVGRQLKLEKREEFNRRPKTYVTRHFVLEVTVAKDGADWKIRSGLTPPVSIAIMKITP